MRSRERKLQLFLELLQPGPETTVLDVGVTDAPFGGGSTDNFFEALYPWPDQVTAVGERRSSRFRAAFPAVTAVQADGRELPFADGDVRPRLLERRRRARRGAATEQRRFVHELCRVARAGLRDDAEPLLPARGALAACRSRTGCRAARATGCCAPAASTTCSSRSGPQELASLFPYSVRVLNRGMTLIAVGPR